MSEEDEGLCLWHVLVTLWGVYSAYPEPFKGRQKVAFPGSKSTSVPGKPVILQTSCWSIPQLTGFYKPALNVLACSVVHQCL